MSQKIVYTGACFCGAVEIKAEGEPILMGYCHCDSCRRWSAAPVNAFALWNTGEVHVTMGVRNIRTYNKTADTSANRARRAAATSTWSTPRSGLIDIRPAVIRRLPFKPEIHIFYAESVLKIDDGLPKFDGMPDENKPKR
ncbi:MAG TPA: GFA family protein [Thermodesulfobacteriota bacterium]|nr:GFA family protein [Thermodesulfobacteriota bacterium]